VLINANAYIDTRAIIAVVAITIEATSTSTKAIEGIFCIGF